MKLYWLELAEEDLDTIYYFYAKNKSLKAATKIYNDILDAAEQLIKFPQSAPIEQNISEDKEEYRALTVRKLFKVIYFIEGSAIYIAAVWDCRQSPTTNRQRVK